MNLSPVGLIDDPTLYRTPLHVEGGNYRIWVGDGMIRYMTKQELPDEIAKKLAMVMAYDDGAKPNKHFGNVPLHEPLDQRLPDFRRTHFYIMPDWYDKNYFDVGWRVRENYFCLVVSELVIVSLRGEILNGDT